jgi:hypothetical protein
MSANILKYEFSVITEKKIIHEKMYGFWNKEVASAYTRDFENAVQPLLSGKWAKCIDLREWNPSNPAVMTILTSHLKWARDNNMAYSANIVVTKVPRLQMNTMLRLGKPEMYYDFFEDEESAFKWLESKGF